MWRFHTRPYDDFFRLQSHDHFICLYKQSDFSGFKYNGALLFLTFYFNASKKNVLLSLWVDYMITKHMCDNIVSICIFNDIVGLNI